MTYQDAEYRYRNDPVYHAMVDALVHSMEEMHLTPGEVRDAAMLASIIFERKNPLPIGATIYDHTTINHEFHKRT